MSQKEVAEAIGSNSATASQNLQKLEERGLVSLDRTNKSRVGCTLTPLGKREAYRLRENMKDLPEITGDEEDIDGVDVIQKRRGGRGFDLLCYLAEQPADAPRHISGIGSTRDFDQVTVSNTLRRFVDGGIAEISTENDRRKDHFIVDKGWNAYRFMKARAESEERTKSSGNRRRRKASPIQSESGTSASTKTPEVVLMNLIYGQGAESEVVSAEQLVVNLELELPTAMEQLRLLSERGLLQACGVGGGQVKYLKTQTGKEEYDSRMQKSLSAVTKTQNV